MITAPSHSDLYAIGRLVYKMQPNLAWSLVELIGKHKAHNCDPDGIHQVKRLLKVFCASRGLKAIPEDSSTGTLYLKHVFLAAVFKLYNPNVLSKLHSNKMMPRLRVELARELKWNANCISHSIPVIITRLTVYDDFANDVLETTALLRKHI